MSFHLASPQLILQFVIKREDDPQHVRPDEYVENSLIDPSVRSYREDDGCYTEDAKDHIENEAGQNPICTILISGKNTLSQRVHCHSLLRRTHRISSRNQKRCSKNVDDANDDEKVGCSDSNA